MKLLAESSLLIPSSDNVSGCGAGVKNSSVQSLSELQIQMLSTVTITLPFESKNKKLKFLWKKSNRFSVKTWFPLSCCLIIVWNLMMYVLRVSDEMIDSEWFVSPTDMRVHGKDKFSCIIVNISSRMCLRFTVVLNYCNDVSDQLILSNSSSPHCILFDCNFPSLWPSHRFLPINEQNAFKLSIVNHELLI